MMRYRYAPKVGTKSKRLSKLVIMEQMVTTMEGTVTRTEEIALTGGGEK